VKSNNNAEGFSAFFEAIPRRVIGDFGVKYGPINQPRLAPAQPCRLRTLALTVIPMTAKYFASGTKLRTRLKKLPLCSDHDFLNTYG
jgi:hypothetical protein